MLLREKLLRNEKQQKITKSTREFIVASVLMQAAKTT